MIVGTLRVPNLSGVLPMAMPGMCEPLLPWKACFGAWHEAQDWPRGSDRFVSSKMRLPRSCASVSAFSSSERTSAEDWACADALNASGASSPTLRTRAFAHLDDIWSLHDSAGPGRAMTGLTGAGGCRQ